MVRPVNFYPVDIVGSTSAVQLDVVQSSTSKLQGTSASGIVGFLEQTFPEMDYNLHHHGGIENEANILSGSGISDFGFILNPSFLFAPGSTAIVQADFNVNSPVFLQGVVGSGTRVSGTLEPFFDTSPFYLFSDHETDPNTERDLHELEQFMVFSKTFISTYPVTGRIPTSTSIIIPTVSSAGDDFLTNKTTSVSFINSNPPALEQVIGFQGVIDTPTATGTFTTIEGPISISGTVDIDQQDASPPYFDEQIPIAGSRFNDPNETQVEFGSMDVFIDGVQIITSSVTVTGSTWPTASKSILSPSNYKFIFNRGAPFAQQSTVTVSGFLEDFGGNTTTASYNFTMLGSGTLGATITGSIDADPPVITPINPVDLQTQVSPDTSILWTLTDNAAGVDASSVKLYINDELRLDNETTTSGSFFKTGTSQAGYTYTFTPSEQFGFGTLVSGIIQASDFATIPNTDSLNYSFTTSPTDSLRVQNFFLSDGESILLTSGTEISVDVVDDLYGVDVSETFMTVNGSVPAGLNTTVITSGIKFTVPAEPLINFREELTLLVHAENLFPGSFPQIEEKVFVLRPGYDVNWPNTEFGLTESIFPYLTNIIVLADVKNFASNFKEGSAFYQVLTEPRATSNLGASIESNIKTAELPAVIESLNPFFEYGKTIVLDIEVDDLEGNQLSFTHTFTIESN